jgi:hypothetical protein
MIYQFDLDLICIAEYTTLSEAERITGIPEKTISSAVLKGGLCRNNFYFSRSKNFVIKHRVKGQTAGRKFTVTVTEKMWNDILVAIGQQNKQSVFRKLLQNWINSQNDKY